MQVRKLAPYRSVITKSVVLFYFFILLEKFYNLSLPFQFQKPVFQLADFDLAYWFFNFTGLNQLIFGNYWGGIVFSIFMLLVLMLTFKFYKSPLIITAFFIVFFIYAIGFNINLNHSTHLFSGILLLPLCFVFYKDDNFELMWESYRYYVCWIYFSAFLMKVYHGSFFQLDFGIVVLKENSSWIIYAAPSSVKAAILNFFIAHPFLTNAGNYLMIALEGSFIIGFFTKKIDRFFLFLIPTLHFVFFVFVDVVFYEQIVLALLFVSVPTWNAISKKWHSVKQLFPYKVG